MNIAASTFYKIENAIICVVALLMLLNTALIIIPKGDSAGWGMTIIFLNIVVGSLGFLCWLWRIFLNDDSVNGCIYALMFAINRCLLYLFVAVGFLLNYNIPRTLKRTHNHQAQLQQERFENRFMCKYVHGEAPIENGVWVFNYQRPHRYGGRFDQIHFEVHCKDGKLHGLAKEEHLNRNLWVENYYTNGFLDSNAIFRREFIEEGRDTITKMIINNFDYLNSKHLCPK